MDRPLQTVVETQEFLRRAAKLLSDDERAAIVEMLARDPECGEIIQGAGGIRKVRVALEGRGKRGGGRVIYYFHNDQIPLFVLSIFAKNEKADLAPAELKALATKIRGIKQDAKG